MGGGAAGRSLRKLGLGQQREQRRSAGSAAGRLLCLPAGVTCGGGGHLNWGLEHSGKWGRGQKGVVCGIYRRHGEGERRPQLGFCCSPRDKPAGLSLLGEQRADSSLDLLRSPRRMNTCGSLWLCA